MIRSRFTSFLILIILLVGITACGGGGSTTSAVSRDVAQSNSLSETTQARRSEAVATPELLTGSIDLEWVAPVARTDGTPLQLTDIGGFRIYYGQNKGDYSHYVDVPDGTAQNVTLRDLPLGTYYLVMTTYDVNGLESDYSSKLRKIAS